MTIIHIYVHKYDAIFQPRHFNPYRVAALAFLWCAHNLVFNRTMNNLTGYHFKDVIARKWACVSMYECVRMCNAFWSSLKKFKVFHSWTLKMAGYDNKMQSMTENYCFLVDIHVCVWERTFNVGLFITLMPYS